MIRRMVPRGCPQGGGTSREPGVDVELVHRGNRAGYKAGALQAALPRARGEFIAVFDADFLPPTAFLRELLPILSSRTSAACRLGGIT